MSLILELGGGPDLASLPLFLRPLGYATLAFASASAGDPTSAADWADRAVAAADATDLPPFRGQALMAQAHASMARSHHALAAEYYQQAADVFASIDMMCARAWALTLGTPCAATAGHPDEAAQLLVLAIELARRCGARRLHDEAESVQRRLAAAAASAPEPNIRARLAVLTDREREIARIASTGIKTREIAERLCLSPRTVDVHLTRVYRKLNISSKAALVRFMNTFG
jgi:DNA-binding CsgD family transcriptional regulator